MSTRTIIEAAESAAIISDAGESAGGMAGGGTPGGGGFVGGAASFATRRLSGNFSIRFVTDAESSRRRIPKGSRGFAIEPQKRLLPPGVNPQSVIACENPKTGQVAVFDGHGWVPATLALGPDVLAALAAAFALAPSPNADYGDHGDY